MLVQGGEKHPLSLLLKRISENDCLEHVNVPSFDSPHSLLGFPGGTSGKEIACQCRRHRRHGFDPWVEKIPGGERGSPLQYSCLENPIDRAA